jgi:hypothetical protein
VVDKARHCAEDGVRQALPGRARRWTQGLVRSCVLRWQKFGGVSEMGFGRMHRGKVGRGGSGERQF